MSRALDRLIQNSSRDSRRSHYSRDFRKSYYSVNVVDPTLELIDLLKQAPEGWDEVDTSTDDRKVPEGWDEVDTAPGESEGYRYRLLPKIFSNVREIYSSPKLRRQLIQYYIKNRRKERMRHRGYSRRMRHLARNGRLSANYLIHNMYMELGRVMYFSFLAKLREAWNRVRVACCKFLVKGGLSAFNTMILTGVGGVLSWLSAKFLNQKWLVKLGTWTSETARIVKADPMTTWPALVTGFVLGLIIAGGVFLIGATALDKNGECKDLEISTSSILTAVYGHGQDIVFGAIKALAPVLPQDMQVKDTNDTNQLIATFAQYMMPENSSQLESFFKGLLSKIENSELRDYFHRVEGSDNVLETIQRLKNNEKDKISISCEVSSQLAQLIRENGGKRFHVPETITLSSKSGQSKNLPNILQMLAVITSPSITFNIETDASSHTIEFNASEYFKKYGNITDEKIEAFVVLYVKNYDKLIKEQPLLK
jgi:hypothetical protein